MAILELIKKRYSCRAYEDRPIEPEKLEKVFEAARLAPSAKNFQDWRFVVSTDKKIRPALVAAACDQEFLAGASAIIVACSDNDYVMRCGEPVGPIDISIALEHIALQAAELGLATCWIGSFDPEKVRALLGIPDGIRVVELMAIGYPTDEPKPRKREPMDKILCYEKWQF